MSEEERLTRKYELKRTIIFIPIKIVITLLIISNFTILSSQLPEFLEKICDFVVTYSILSIIVYISEAVGNWILGLILFFIICFGLSNLPNTIQNILGFFVCIGGFTLDVYRIVQFIKVSRRKKQSVTTPSVTSNDVVTVPDDKQ